MHIKKAQSRTSPMVKLAWLAVCLSTGVWVTLRSGRILIIMRRVQHTFGLSHRSGYTAWIEN